MKNIHPNIAIRILLSLCLLICLGGCQSSAEFWINPDGSGKVVVDWTSMQAPDEDNGLTPNLEAEKFLGEWRGIDQWSKVQFKVDEKGYQLKATGYFKDARKVCSPDQTGSISPFLEWDQDKIVAVGFDAGFGRLRQVPDQGKSLMPAEGIKSFRLECQERLFSDTPFHRREIQMLRTIRFEYKIHAPGRIKDRGKLDKVADDTVRLVLDGGKFLDFAANLMADDEAVGQLVLRHNAPRNAYRDHEVRQKFFEKTFGQDFPLKATIAPDDKPLFDFDAELQRNAVPYPQLLINAKLAPKELPPATPENQLASIGATIHGDSMLVFLNIKGETRAPYDTFVSPGEITKLIDENGQVALPAIGVSRSLTVNSVYHQGSKFGFTLSGILPRGVRHAKLIQGFFLGIRADGTRQVAAGPIDIRPGGATLDGSVQISEIYHNTYTDSKGFIHNSIEMDELLDPSRFIKMIDIEGMGGHGTQTYSWHGYIASRRLPYSDAHPPRGKVTLTELVNPRFVKIPFELRDIEFQADENTGRQRGQ